MTKEELDEEAEEFTDSKKSFWRQGRTCIDSVKQAYIAGAEPREKRIAELERVNKRILTECHKLVETLEKKQKEIAEHEKEKAELKETITKMNNVITKTFSNLTKARGLILNLYNAGRDVLMCRNEELAYTRLDNAINDKRIEQFLKEVSE